MTFCVTSRTFSEMAASFLFFLMEVFCFFFYEGQFSNGVSQSPINTEEILGEKEGAFWTMALHSDSQPSLVEELLGVIKVYSDGSVVRSADDPSLNIPPSQQPLDENGGVASKDVVFDQNLGLWLRIYLPPQPGNDLPVIIYFHGGGFCLYSAAFKYFHSLCLKWCAAVGAIIVSANYRLAPEHRLPTAYEDSMAALEWLRSQSLKQAGGEGDPWFNSHADFSRVYLMGDSAGGTIAHHAAVWAGGKNWEELRIRGMILLQPFFAGRDRTASEIACPEDAVLNLEGADKLWRLALPIGASRDHPFCNPFGPESPDLTNTALPPALVVIGGRDLLRDRQLEYCEALKKCGKEIQMVVFEEEGHAFYAFKLEEESSLQVIKYASEFLRRSA